MSVLNNLVAMPNRIAIACEYLYFLGDQGVEWEAVEKQLSPLKKVDADEVGDKPSGKSIAEDVLREMEKLKLLTILSNSAIILSTEIRKIAPMDGDWQQALRPILFSRLVLSEIAEQHGQSDVPDAIAWLLTQDPFNPMPWGGGTHVERIISQLGDNDQLRSVIGNNSRYQNLLYWARYLGCAEWLGTPGVSVVIPDPSEAISWLLPQVFYDEHELPIKVFMQRLSEICPVLEGGNARNNLEKRIGDEFHLKEHHLSRSTSLALNRLQLRGVIKIKASSDAQTWILDLGRETPPVSYVSLVEGGGK